MNIGKTTMVMQTNEGVLFFKVEGNELRLLRRVNLYGNNGWDLLETHLSRFRKCAVIMKWQKYIDVYDLDKIQEMALDNSSALAGFSTRYKFVIQRNSISSNV